jgi:hypothetical protein
MSTTKLTTETSLPTDAIAPNNESAKDNLLVVFVVPQVVHCHVNGLCIVTAGDVALWLGTHYPKKTIKSVQTLAKEPPPFSAAEKRKRQTKMLRGGEVEHAVTPSTILAKLTLTDSDDGRPEDDIEIPICAGVWGTIVEVNENLNSKVVLEDPLLDGYIAVILPTGNFPLKKGTSA